MPSRLADVVILEDKLTERIVLSGQNVAVKANSTGSHRGYEGASQRRTAEANKVKENHRREL
jgi:hypothetical protein